MLVAGLQSAILNFFWFILTIHLIAQLINLDSNGAGLEPGDMPLMCTLLIISCNREVSAM